MKILSYNISWESMTGLNKKWKYCNNTIPGQDRYFGECIANIATLIDTNCPYDMIALQEASNYEKLIEHTSCLKTMKKSVHQSGSEQMVTFWNPSYKLIKNIKGNFQLGRPWNALIFDHNLCFINIHAGHYHMYMLIKHLDYMMRAIQDYVDLSQYRVVIAGDFNAMINAYYKHLILANKNFFISGIQLETLKQTYHKKIIQFDHIIDSYREPQTMYSPMVNNVASLQTSASDHLPIIAILY